VCGLSIFSELAFGVCYLGLFEGLVALLRVGSICIHKEIIKQMTHNFELSILG
jgi:hypothetical protein